MAAAKIIGFLMCFGFAAEGASQPFLRNPATTNQWPIVLSTNVWGTIIGTNNTYLPSQSGSSILGNSNDLTGFGNQPSVVVGSYNTGGPGNGQSIAVGYGNHAIVYQGISIGFSNSTEGISGLSMAIGHQNQADADIRAVAIGQLNKVSGARSFAIGNFLTNLFADQDTFEMGVWDTNKIQIKGGSVYVRSNIFMLAPTNGVAPPPSVTQPIGLFGSMMLSLATNTVTIGASGTYYTLTNYSVARTNGFGANLATGFLTNTVAGYYRVTVYASMIGGGSDTLEGETFLNETGREEISLFGSYDNPARVRTMSSTGILYIPANTGISFRLNNRSDTDNITVWRAAITVGTP